MIKRITRKETLDDVVGLITRRATTLIDQGKHADSLGDDDLGHELRRRAWELEMVLQDIDHNLR
jgi:hypothetical protein